MVIDNHARYEYAQRLFAERHYTQAARELEGILEAMGQDGGVTGLGDTSQLLARAYYHSAQLPKAEAAARGLVDADPSDGYAAILLARTLQRQGRRDEAAGWLRRAEALGATLD